MCHVERFSISEMRRLLSTIDLNYRFKYLVKRRSSVGIHTVRLCNDDDCQRVVRRLPNDHVIRVYLEDEIPTYDELEVLLTSGNTSNGVNQSNAGPSTGNVNGVDATTDECV